jgi:Holliday junction resolvase RusA-like endonuclease
VTELPLGVEWERSLTVRFGTPPSANRYWRTVLLPGRGKKNAKNPFGMGAIVLKSTEARVYAQNVKVDFYRQVGHDFTPFAGPVAVHIVWCRERRSGDLDNRIKIVLDAIKGLAYEDDSQIVEEHAYRRDGLTPGVHVTIRELT